MKIPSRASNFFQFDSTDIDTQKKTSFAILAWIFAITLAGSFIWYEYTMALGILSLENQPIVKLVLFAFLATVLAGAVSAGVTINQILDSNSNSLTDSRLAMEIIRQNSNLENENEHLKARNTELEKEAGYQANETRKLKKEKEELQKEIKSLRAKLQLERSLWGCSLRMPAYCSGEEITFGDFFITLKDNSNSSKNSAKGLLQ